MDYNLVFESRGVSEDQSISLDSSFTLPPRHRLSCFFAGAVASVSDANPGFERHLRRENGGKDPFSCRFASDVALGAAHPAACR